MDDQLFLLVTYREQTSTDDRRCNIAVDTSDFDRVINMWSWQVIATNVRLQRRQATSLLVTSVWCPTLASGVRQVDCNSKLIWFASFFGKCMFSVQCTDFRSSCTSRMSAIHFLVRWHTAHKATWTWTRLYFRWV